MKTKQIAEKHIAKVMKEMYETHMVIVLDFVQPIKTPLSLSQEYKHIVLYIGSDNEAALESYNEYPLLDNEAVVYIHQNRTLKLRGYAPDPQVLEILSDEGEFHGYRH